MNRDKFDFPAELDGLAFALEPAPDWLTAPSGELTVEEIETRLSWLEREARAGRIHVLPGVLGPDTLVQVRVRQVLVRSYEGVDVLDA